MKSIVTAMVGIATLVCGVIGSVATAHDADEAGVHKHEYFVSAIHRNKNYGVRAVAPGDQNVTVKIVVTDQTGANVGSNVTRTLQAGVMYRLLPSSEALAGNSTLNFRSVRITASDEIWIHFTRIMGDHGVINLPVLHRILPTTEGTDKDDPPLDGPKE